LIRFLIWRKGRISRRLGEFSLGAWVAAIDYKHCSKLFDIAGVQCRIYTREQKFSFEAATVKMTTKYYHKINTWAFI
jgi:hypothetical protein